MKLRSVVTPILFFYLVVPVPSTAQAAPPSKVVMTTGSVSEREAALYIAQDQGLFRRYGLDVSLVQVRNGPVGMSALSSGESQLHWGSVSAANLGAIAEGADLVFVAGFINRLTGVFLANPKIKSPLELKGKTIGVNSLSGGAWIFSMLTLDYWGLVPERDKIQFRSLGDQSVIAQALTVGTVDAAYMGYTYGKIVQSKGFRLLAELEKLPIPYQGSGLMARRSFIAASSSSAENIFKALLDGVDFIRNPANKAQVLKSLVKGMRLARADDAEEGYYSMANLYERKVYLSAVGVHNVISLLGTTNEEIRRLRAESL